MAIWSNIVGRTEVDGMSHPIKLDPKRTIATAAKLIAENPTIEGREQVASVLLQWFGAGNAKPYEVTND